MSMFTKYIKDYDESLTDVEAMTIAASIVQGLPMLFDANKRVFHNIDGYIDSLNGRYFLKTSR